MFAVISTGGKQYRVQQGSRLQVEKLVTSAGEKITFDNVLSIGDGKGIRIGTPHVEGAQVEAKVVDNIRDKKIRVIKFKRRKHYMRRAGHRQNLTDLIVTAVKA